MNSIAGRSADAAGRALATVARVADRALDVAGLAPPLLDLPPGVRDDLREFFAHTIDPTTVTIRAGHVPGVPHRRAFALPGLIYLGADPGVVGIAVADELRPNATPTLVHELVHIWQGRFVGSRYVVRALGEQVRLGARAYDWRAALAPDGHRGPFPVEAHAQLVSDAYARRHGFSPAAALRWRDEEVRLMDEVLTGLRAGHAGPRPGWTG